MGKTADNPYPGARAFQQADHALYCGRDAETASLVDLWMTNRLSTVTGPVASGKTSLLRAGVYPLMPAKHSNVLPLGSLSYGMTFPFAALPDHNPFTFALLRSWSPDDIPTRLAGLSISDFVHRFTQVSDKPVYAAIDQMDDVLLNARSGPRARWRQQFLAELAQALDDHPRLHLLLAARTEAVGVLAAAVGIGARHALAGLTFTSAVEALKKPAEAAGRCVTDDAASMLIDLVCTGRTDDIEPTLLQVVCKQLWDELPVSVCEISGWAVREFCDANVALAAHCSRAIGQVAMEHELKPRLLRMWLLDNFVTDNGSRGGAYEGMPATAGMPNAVPRGLVDRHLLTYETDESARCYRLLSGRLIEPLRIANVDRTTAPASAEYLAAAERDLAGGELDFAWRNGDHALRSTSESNHRERAQARSVLGNVAYQRGRPDAALPHYRAAADLLYATGDTGAAAYQLAAAGRVLLAEGNAADAVPELRAAVERAPNDLVLQTQLALALWQLGEGRTAVAVLDWVLSFDGGYLEARRARGEILADLGEAKSAMADLDRALPARPSTQAARGLALAELGNHTAATEEVNDAVASAQRNGQVLLYAARALDL
ncbi:MAG TPA: tetratricopeptide repeat protein, partial [Streptosporangiaceae bacterium]|nr:tetratricopeptide repeat protein [Streptosporangiaceae bacterium]